MNRRHCEVLVFLWLAVSAGAGPLEPGDVGRSARWVIHLDSQALWTSQLGGEIRKIADSHDIQAKLGAIKTLFGTDLTADIHSVTLYGPDGNDVQAVALVKGRMDRPKLVSMAVLTDRYEKITQGDSVIHRWGDGGEKKTQYMGFASDDKLVMSQSHSAVEMALEVLDGKADSVQGTERFNSIKHVPGKAFVVVCAEELSDLTKGQANAEMLQRSSVLTVIVGENDAFVNATLWLETESREAAVQIETMGRGILAMMQFNDAKFAKLKPLVAACSLASHDTRVEFSFRYPIDKLMAMIEPHILKAKEGQE
ncbi:MAG: hypothetical protein GY809_27350 [Planctomycetes bacterium]|nr:hypothetical protein [Planctomycetota bacterium]